MSLAASISKRVFTFTRFPLDVPLKWDAPTSSSTMRDLVDRREDIFTKQRQAGDAALQSRSDKVAVANLATRHRADRAALAAYKRFCALADIPPYPITYALLALVVYARCSAEDKADRSLRAILLRLMSATAEIWEEHPTYDELCDMDGDGTAFAEFWREHHGKKTKAGVARRTVTSTRPSGRARPSYVGQDELGGSSESSDSEDYSDAEEVEDPTPSMPQPGDVFSSTQSAEQAVMRALVPVYGYSTRTKHRANVPVKIRCMRSHEHYLDSADGVCGFSIVVKKSSSTQWVVDGDASTYEHTHGPHPSLLADPSWRPNIRKAAARRALGSAPSSAGVGSRKRKLVEMLGASDEDDDEDTEMDERVGEMPEKLGPGQWEGRDRRAGTSSESPQHITYERVGQPKPRRPSSPPPPPPPPPALSTSNAVSPRSAFALDHATVSPTYDLVAILHALEPSLASLAPHLAAAGINSVDAVVALISLEPATLDLLFDDLRLVVHPADRSRPSIVQLKLLKKLFEEERVVRRGDRGV
ncbi:hypothetical protein JCM9279_007483 [Rhodotorula babjevae]